MTQRAINNAIRAIALGAAVAVALTACESTTAPTTTQRPATVRTVSQLVVGTWMQDAAVGLPQYYHFRDDGTAVTWTESASITSQEDLVFDLNWEIEEEAPSEVVIQGFGVLTYDRQDDVLLDGNGEIYSRALLRF